MLTPISLPLMILYERACKILGKYLSRHPLKHGSLRHGSDVFIIVVIPAYKEGDFLPLTIRNLMECEAPVLGKVRVVIVLNSGEKDITLDEEGQRIMVQNAVNGAPEWLEFEVLEAWGLPKKIFGAGAARKIGMDAAAELFQRENRPFGIIVTLDADSIVERNYFRAIEEWFSVEDRSGANIYFEHSLHGDAFSDEVYEAICSYELHLRYMRLAQSWAGFIYPFHSLGSAIATRAVSYARTGGMPCKQAGEDFYFLQKLIPLGNFGEINSTVVRPSPRVSDRVIFGTGAAISAHVEGRGSTALTHNLRAYEHLKGLFDIKDELFGLAADQYESWTYKLEGPVRSYLLNSGFFKDIDVIKADCSSVAVFGKRFFEVFNAFRIVKYLNYVHTHFFEKSPVFDAASELALRLDLPAGDLLTEEELLVCYREYEKANPLFIS